MNTATIEDLAHLIKQAQKEGLPKPIVFLGAGASKTGGVPLAGEIINDILEKYKDTPKIKLIKEEEKTYPILMSYLSPFDRNKLLKEYIDRAKINVTHIYLAQLIVNGYIDYVLTVNFDNLMLRALALYNEFPPTYDMAILKDLTTTSFKEKSVVYLHGQHHGLWLLNTKEEMKKVEELIPPILNSIKNQRVWIFIGYSGEDPIFEHVTKLGRFDNGLYWITYNDNNPCDKVCEELLDKANTNAFLIKDYDSDSFMLKLNSQLELDQPKIIDKPFSSLKDVLENIVDIDDKENFKKVKERLEIAKKNVNKSIEQFEEGKIETNQNFKSEINIDLLKKQIIDIIIKNDFKKEEIQILEETTKDLKNDEIDELMVELYHSYGNYIADLAELKGNELLYIESLEKYNKAAELDPNDVTVLYNWGTTLSQLAKLKDDESLYQASFEKFKRATKLYPKDARSFSNWANAIADLAQLKSNESLYLQSFELFKKAAELNPKKASVFNNWGAAISELAKLKNNESLYLQSFELFKKAAELNPKDASIFNNWGAAISELAKLKNNESLHFKSIEKFIRAVELNSKDASSFNNWGSALTHLGKLKNDESLFKASFDKLNKAIELGGDSYNLACLYAVQNKKTDALILLEQCLKEKEIRIDFVKNDDDWESFLEDEDFISLLEKFK